MFLSGSTPGERKGNNAFDNTKKTDVSQVARRSRELDESDRDESERDAAPDAALARNARLLEKSQAGRRSEQFAVHRSPRVDGELHTRRGRSGGVARMSGKYQSALNALGVAERCVAAALKTASAEPDELARAASANCALIKDENLPTEIRARLENISVSVLLAFASVRKAAQKEARAEILAFVGRSFVVFLYLLVVGFSFWNVSCVFVAFPVACVEYTILRESYVLRICARVLPKAAFWKT